MKTGSELHKQLLAKEITATEIARNHLKRIAAFDEQTKAFISVCEKSVLEQASKIDAKIAKGESVGKLAGIPIAIKDNIHIKDHITTCGSKFLENYKAPFNATVTQRIEDADGLIIGKTNLDEFAMGSSTEHSAYKLTNNPWDLKCVPGGSSGGSAAAVAARLCSIALGSDTGGSIRQPASFTGIFGFKPTYGRVSRYGLVAFASSLDQIGPFTASVEDTARIFDVLSGHCPHDSTSIQTQTEDYLSMLKENLEGKKIGVPKAFANKAQPDVVDAFEKALQTYRELGAEIVDIEMPILRYGVPTYYILSTAEASTNLARFDGVRYGKRTTHAQNLKEIYTKSREEGFGEEVKQRILLGTYVLSSGFKDAYYLKAQKVRQLFINEFNTVFSRVDVIATPTAPTAAFEHHGIQDPLEMYLQDMYTIPANLAGLPSMSIPAGFNEKNLPLGIQITAPQLCDSRVLQFAHHFENATDFSAQVPPEFDKELP